MNLMKMCLYYVAPLALLAVGKDGGETPILAACLAVPDIPSILHL